MRPGGWGRWVGWTVCECGGFRDTCAAAEPFDQGGSPVAGRRRGARRGARLRGESTLAATRWEVRGSAR